MQTTWLKQKGNRQCILFFAGWGMDPTPFSGIPVNESDLCMVFDYRQLSPIDLAPFVAYEQLHLISWSMGVWVAAHLLAEQRQQFTSLTAIGGTLEPIDQKQGIPPENYQSMLTEFSSEILEGFYRNMFDEEAQLSRFLAHRPQRDIPALVQEMAAFQKSFTRLGPGVDIYSRKIITSRDRIFSGRNQMRAWGKGIGVARNWPHFPFFLIEDWCDLLRD
ncbi:MAG: pimeloyl-ACP methyl esterase BioG family protein [Desulfobulbus sp.]